MDRAYLSGRTHLSPKEFGQAVGKSVRTISRWMRVGEVRSKKIRGSVLIPVEELTKDRNRKKKTTKI